MNSNPVLESTRHLCRTLGLVHEGTKRAVSSRLVDDRGEGVISMAIAILVIAALGVAMYAVFQNVGEAAGDKAVESVNNIGS